MLVSFSVFTHHAREDGHVVAHGELQILLGLIQALGYGNVCTLQVELRLPIIFQIHQRFGQLMVSYSISGEFLIPKKADFMVTPRILILTQRLILQIHFQFSFHLSDAVLRMLHRFRIAPHFR